MQVEADYTILAGEKKYRDRYGNEHKMRAPAWVYPCRMIPGQLKLEKSSADWIKNCVGPYIRQRQGGPVLQKPAGVVYKKHSVPGKKNYPAYR